MERTGSMRRRGLSLRGRMWLSTGLVVLVCAAASLPPLLLLRGLGDAMDTLVHQRLRHSQLARVIEHQALQCRRYEKDCLLNLASRERLLHYEARWEESFRKLDAAARELRRVAPDLSIGAGRIPADLLATVGAYRRVVVGVLEEIRRGRIASPSEGNLAIAPFKQPIRELIGLSHELSHRTTQAAAEAEASVRAHAGHLQSWSISAGLLLAILFCGLLAFSMRWVARRLRHLQKHVEALNARDHAFVVSDPYADELQACHEALQTLNHALHTREERLLADLEQVQNSNRAKDGFLANMNHEVRTPITALLGYARMLGDQGLAPAEREDCLTGVERNAMRLTETMDSILEFCLVSTQAVESSSVRIEIRELCRFLARECGRLADDTQRLDLVVSSALPSSLRTDPERLVEACRRLVDNALRFSGSSGVRCSLACTETDFEIQVQDLGPGMSEAQVAKALSPLTQVEASSLREGDGLGLPLAKAYAELLGGSLEIRGGTRRGTSCILRWPLSALQASHEHIPAEAFSELRHGPGPGADGPGLEGLRVLFAEDAEDNRRIIGHILGRAGAKVTLVEDGALAVQAFELSPDAFDLVLMDLQMPVLGGLEATRMLRDAGCRLPIIALTAHSLTEDKRRCLDAGCTDFLSKPVAPGLLLATLRTHMAPSTSGSAVS